MSPLAETQAAPARQLLHDGCGPNRQERLPACFRTTQWQEIRLDIDPNVKPHIVGSITDLRAIARHIALDQLVQPLYESASGPISALDVVFGHQASLANGNHYMAHRTGFTASTLGQCLLDAGFDEVRVHQGQRWDLWAIATLADTPADCFDALDEVML